MTATLAEIARLSAIIAEQKAELAEYNGFKEGADRALMHLRSKVTELTTALEEANARLVENNIRAAWWMDCHDKLKAGKPYSFPKPVTAVEALSTARSEEREACARLAENYNDWNPYPTICSAIAAAIRARGEPAPVIIQPSWGSSSENTPDDRAGQADNDKEPS